MPLPLTVNWAIAKVFGLLTVEQIKENPYLQYFIGQTHYSNEVPFDASLLVRFRERINVDLVNQINERMVSKSQTEIEREDKKKAQEQKA